MKYAKKFILLSVMASALIPSNGLAMAQGKDPKDQKPTKLSLKEKFNKKKNKMRSAFNQNNKSEASTSKAQKKQSTVSKVVDTVKSGLKKVKSSAVQKKATVATFVAAGLFATSPKAREKAWELFKKNPTTALAAGLGVTGVLTAENINTAQDALNHLRKKAEENPMAASALGATAAYGLFKAGKDALKTSQYKSAMNVVVPAVGQNIKTVKSWYNSTPGVFKMIAGFVVETAITNKIQEYMSMDAQAEDPEAEFITVIRGICQLPLREALALAQTPDFFERLQAKASQLSPDMVAVVEQLQEDYTTIREILPEGSTQQQFDELMTNQENRQQFEMARANIEHVSNAIISRNIIRQINPELLQQLEGQEPTAEELDNEVPTDEQILAALANPRLREAVENQAVQNDEQPADEQILRALQAPHNAGNNLSLDFLLQHPNFGLEIRNNPIFRQVFQRAMNAQDATAQNSRQVQAAAPRAQAAAPRSRNNNRQVLRRVKGKRKRIVVRSGKSGVKRKQIVGLEGVMKAIKGARGRTRSRH